MATSIDQLLDMVLTESVEGHSHQCLACCRTFTPTEDGCPFCRSAQIAPLQTYLGTGTEFKKIQGGGE